MTNKRLLEELRKRFPHEKIEFEKTRVRIGQASYPYEVAVKFAKDTNSVYKVL